MPSPLLRRLCERKHSEMWSRVSKLQGYDNYRRAFRKDKKLQYMVSDWLSWCWVTFLVECLLVFNKTIWCFPQQQMSMVLTAVDHLNQATAEATASERCTIKTEETAGAGTANEEGATTFTTSGDFSIGSASTWRMKISILVAWPPTAVKQTLVTVDMRISKLGASMWHRRQVL